MALTERLRQAAAELGPNALNGLKNTIASLLTEYAEEFSRKHPTEAVNGVMMQYFHWYIDNDGNHWKRVKENAKDLANAGITALWLPPAYKASGGAWDVGYGAYDLFDLGEFDQKGTIRTKYGTKDEYAAAIKAAQEARINVYADVVFNHKNGADAEEEIEAYPVDPNDRNHVIGGVEKIKSWTAFNFPGRGDTYSSMKWRWWHFDSVNHNMYKPGNNTIYRFKDKSFETKVDLSSGNYDFLMGCDLDMNHPEVQGELKYWGKWLLDTIGVDGFRLDAIKHIQGDFFTGWIDYLEQETGKDLFAVGEYWSENLAALHWYIANTGGRMSLFDVPLHYNFHRASKSSGHYDMRRILDGTLMREQPVFAVTFVDNHDSQPLQALESVVESWFKPLAYALILLRAEGYPCIFYADYYGAHYRDRGRDGNEYEIWLDSHRSIIDKFLYARHNFAHGPQYDYFDHWDVIGWTRLGTEANPKAMAVIMSDGPGGSKWMEVGKPNTTFYDLTGHISNLVQTNEHGWGEFRCEGGSVSVWVQK